jgi:hypothetical protein
MDSMYKCTAYKETPACKHLFLYSQNCNIMSRAELTRTPLEQNNGYTMISAKNFKRVNMCKSVAHLFLGT